MKKVKYKRTISIILLAILAIVVLLGWSLKDIQTVSKKECQNRLNEDIIQETKAFADSVERDFAGVKIFTNLAVEDIDSEKVLHKVLEDYCHQRAFTGIHIYWEDGRELVAGKVPKVDKSLHTSFKEEQAKVPYTTNLISNGKYRKDKYICHAIAINPEGKTPAIAYAYIPMDVFAKSVGKDLLGSDRKIYIVDGTTGEYLVDESRRYDGNGKEVPLVSLSKTMPDIHVTEGDYNQVLKDHKQGKAGNFSFYSKASNTDYYTCYRPVGINNWFMIMTIDMPTAFKAFYSIRWIIVIMTICLALGVLVIVVAIISQFRRNQVEIEKMAEKANVANQSKTNFMARMSHDIRTPINGIVGLVHYIKAEIDDREKVDDSLDKIEGLSGQLEMLINEVLEMSRIEQGKTELMHEEFNLEKLLSDMRPAVVSIAENYGVQLTGSHRELQHGHVIGSAVHVQRILMNILSNSIKYNKPGGTSECWATETPIDENHSRYTFTIRDTGIGISEEFMEKIYEPFSRENEHERAGTGLGMAITKELVDLMGGTMEIQSELGEGTTVTINLVFETVEHQAEDNATLEAVSLEGKRVLLAEDSELNRELAKYFLEEEGAIVDTAVNGEEAVTKFRESERNQYEVILMDVRMPVMDGLEATKVIRALDREDAQTIPIFAVTANAFQEDVIACKEAGMNEHLSKPIDGRLLREAIARYI